jgi:ABC-type dipeptide/oligopeptide/nickel transport system ATPase component
MPKFELDSAFRPTADQPAAIASLADGIEAGERALTLLGATGTGKTMAMAATVEAVQKPAQQDAGGAALQRVPHLLPAQCGRVLRLLLRLLPARGLRPQ